MVATFDVARDDILGEFNTAWEANAPAVTPGGSAPVVFWDGIPEPAPPPDDAPWARVQIRHVTGGVTGIGGPVGERRRHTQTGIVTVQIFVPTILDSTPVGVSVSEELAKVALAAFRVQRTTNGVIFREARINEVGSDGPWYNVNVLSDFEYDEFV